MAEKPRQAKSRPAPARPSKANGAAERRPRELPAAGAPPFAALLGAVRAGVETRLVEFLDARLDAAREHGPDVAEMFSAVRDFCLRGGKRLRPALLVAGYRAAGGSRAPLEPAIDAGAALELLQAYFLIHDDWMDRDTVRRGGPTVHALLSRRYRSARLGAASAVLAGDLAVALATEALAEVSAPAERLTRLFRRFAQMQTDAVAGQQLDLLGRTRDIEKTYVLKTASYTVRGPLQLGALLAGAPASLLDTLDRFAMPTGVAFQLRDDLLSAFGDPARTGKPFGNDIKSGKRTWLVSHALEHARGRDRAALDRAWGNTRATEPQLRRAVEALERSGARRAVEQRISELLNEGLAALRAGGLPPRRRALLEGAATVLVERWS